MDFSDDIFIDEGRHSVTVLANRLGAEEIQVVPCPRVAALVKRGAICSCAGVIHSWSQFDITNLSTPRKLGSMIRNQALKCVVLTHLYPWATGCEDEMAVLVGELSGAPTIVGWDVWGLVI
jgi:hypothetical protein